MNGFLPPGEMVLGLLVLWLVVIYLVSWQEQGHRAAPHNGSPRAVAIASVVVAAIWFFGWYDTAQSKCQRGDFGACLIVSAQQGR